MAEQEFGTRAMLTVTADERSLRDTTREIEDRIGEISVQVDADVSGSTGGGSSRIASRDRALNRRLNTNRNDLLEYGVDLDETRNDLLRELVEETEQGNFSSARMGAGGLGGLLGAGVLGAGLLGLGGLATALGDIGDSIDEFRRWFPPEIPVPDWIPPEVPQPEWVPPELVKPDWIPITVDAPDSIPVDAPDSIPITLPWLPIPSGRGQPEGSPSGTPAPLPVEDIRKSRDGPRQRAPSPTPGPARAPSPVDRPDVGLPAWKVAAITGGSAAVLGGSQLAASGALSGGAAGASGVSPGSPGLGFPALLPRIIDLLGLAPDSLPGESGGGTPSTMMIGPPPGAFDGGGGGGGGGGGATNRGSGDVNITNDVTVEAPTMREVERRLDDETEQMKRQVKQILQGRGGGL